jgi:hypothetical protein
MRFCNLRSSLVVAAAALLASALSPLAANDEEKLPRFVGVSTCAKCHDSDATGKQVEAWRNGPHGKSWETLGTEAAAAIAKEAGVLDAQNASECLRCHTTGAGLSKGRFAKSFDSTDGVQCESCHGPGEFYAKIQHMIMNSKAQEMGLIEPGPSLCNRCHNEDSPTYEGFDYRAAIQKIRHPLASY